jgi:NitT/TauT family transport system permease protein/taurine transport system permease protein
VKAAFRTLVVLAAWEAIVRLGWVSPILLPAPTAIASAAVSDGRVFLAAFGVTVVEILASIALAWTLGIVSGLAASRSPMVAVGSASVLSSLFAVPLVILYPLLMAWTGIGMTSKILFGVLSGYFPIALNTLNGMRAVDPAYVTMARAMGANRWQLYTRVLLPFALPSIISGLRIGTGLIVIAVLVAEMLASRDGIGYYISYHRTLFNTGHVYFGFVFAIALALGVNAALSRLERRVR